MLEQLKSLIEKHNKPELAENVGMVYQVWSDGEITLQKSGPLLWQRNLHSIIPGTNEKKQEIVDLFPEKYNGHGFIFCTEYGAREIAKLILPADSIGARMLAIK